MIHFVCAIIPYQLAHASDHLEEFKGYYTSHVRYIIATQYFNHNMTNSLLYNPIILWYHCTARP